MTVNKLIALERGNPSNSNGADVAEAVNALIDGDQLVDDLSQAYEFPTVAAFKASSIEFPDGKTIHIIDVNDNFTKITGTGTANDVNIFASTSVNQSIVKNQVNEIYSAGTRNAIHYNSAQTIYINCDTAVMAEFRFRGQYTKGLARSFPTPAFKNVVSLIDDLGAESVKSADTWYAVFAVANDGDAECQFKLMPFLRLGTPTGNTYPLVEAGENSYAATAAKAHNWGVGIDGVNCLTVTKDEAYAGAGKQVVIQSSTTGSITFTLATGLAKGDYILPAPKDFEFYRYCGCFLNDSAEVRNMADTGYYIGSRASSLTQLQTDGFDVGAVNSAEIRPLGNISPLASGIRIISTSAFSTLTIGRYIESVETDSGLHTVDEDDQYKWTTDTFNYSTRFEIPFGLYAAYYFTNGAALAANRTNGKHLPWGYYES